MAEELLTINELREHSRLKDTNLFSDTEDGVETIFWDLPVMDSVSPDASDRVIPIDRHRRIDEVAVRFYDDPIVWDLIAQTNGIMDIPSQFVPGTMIRIPSLSRMVTSLRA